ncbi:unnamed protein product [Lactuca saligna]|uniref:F-box associated beta-propeller type 3 domain-containing protein n=1 Tax=Lactuca saligna TaxID=75948 RepID=A0AA36E8B5_LACSI|nr:unnamed protein product [Lactuca saligna]
MKEQSYRKNGEDEGIRSDLLSSIVPIDLPSSNLFRSIGSHRGALSICFSFPMATTGDGRAPYKSDGVGKKLCKRPFEPEIDEEPQNISQEAGKNNSTGGSELSTNQGRNYANISATIGISEIEQILKQRTFTRSETLYLIALLHSRTIEESPSDNFLAASKISRIASPADANKGSTMGTGPIALRQDSKFIYKNATMMGSPRQSTTIENLPNELLLCRFGTLLSLPSYSVPSDGSGWIKVLFRFGFDPKTDDYKVVKLTAFAKGFHVKWWMDVEIYSMKKGSWKLITERFPSHITWIDENEVVCADGHDGYLHWLGCTNEEEDIKTIVAFDLGSETFREIPFPDSTLYHDRIMVLLGALGGKLCVMSCYKDVGCVVWVMEEYGWVKRHVFSQFIGDTYPFGFTSANKFLIQDQYSRLVLYDPVTEEAQILKNDFSYPEFEAGKVVEYMDSLVWVAPAKRIETQRSQL